MLGESMKFGEFLEYLELYETSENSIDFKVGVDGFENYLVRMAKDQPFYTLVNDLLYEVQAGVMLERYSSIIHEEVF